MKSFFRLKMSPGFESGLLITPALTGAVMASGAVTMAEYAGAAAMPLLLMGLAVSGIGTVAALALLNLVERCEK